MASDEKKSMKGTKLSLSKKHKNNRKGSTTISKVLPSVSESLNESSEFQEPMKFGETGGDGDYLKDDDPIHCQVCGKKLNHMNSQRRAQHVNKCIDAAEEKVALEQKEAAMLETARTLTLGCPMCGKPFKTDSARQAHLKKCSQALGVGTDQMLQLIRDQETEREVLVAGNIVPPVIRKAVEKQTETKKKRTVKEPKNQFEEELQVAMAISSSLIEESEDCDVNMMLKDTANVKRGKDTKKGKKTGHSLQETCLLMTLSHKEKLKRLEGRVSQVLSQQDADVLCSPRIPLLDSELRISGPYGRADTSLWQKAALQDSDSGQEMFYVGTLMPPISYSKTGAKAKIKRLSTIPGREASFIVPKARTEKRAHLDESMHYDEVIAASTQTAAVLAELASDETKVGDLTQLMAADGDVCGTPEGSRQTTKATEKWHGLSLKDGVPVDLHASGFCVEKLSLKESDRHALQCQTLSDFRQLINKQDTSDVTVTCLDCSFHAHSLILAARCPQLVKHIEKSTVHLTISAEAAWSLLTFIYAGELTVSQSAQKELLELSESLAIPQLKEACSCLFLDEEADSSNNKAGDASNEVMPQINLKDIWGESDSDEDDEDDNAGKSNDDNVDQSTDDAVDVSDEINADSESVCVSNLSAGVCDIDVGTNDAKEVSNSDSQTCGITNCNIDMDSENSDVISNGEQEQSGCSSDGIQKNDNYGRKHKLESDDNEMFAQYPSTKRIRISNTVQESYTNTYEERETHSSGETKSESIIDADSPAKEIGSSNKVDLSSVTMDTSGVDLFDSPSPVITRSSRSRDLRMQNSPVSCKSQFSNRKHQIEINKDLDKESQVFKSYNDTTKTPLKETSDRIASVPVTADCESTFVEDNNVYCEMNASSQDDGVCSNPVSESDDLEITGDNFSEIEINIIEPATCMPLSPVFSGKTEPQLACQASSDSTYTEIDPPSDYAHSSLVNIVKMNKKPCEVYNDTAKKFETPTDRTDGITDNSEPLEVPNNVDNENFDYDLEPCFDDSFNELNIPLTQVCKENLKSNSDEADADVSGNVADGSAQDKAIDVDDEPEKEDTIEVKPRKENVEVEKIAADDTSDGFDSSVWEDYMESGMDCVIPVDYSPVQASRDKPSGSVFRTPHMEQPSKPKKPWVAPSPFTPMPNYNTMATPHLKKAVSKFGVKPVGKKRMIKMLEDIYQQTHQYETDSEVEDAYQADSEPMATDGRTDTSGEEDLSASQDTACSQDTFRDLPEESFLHIPSSDSDTSLSPQKAGDLKKKLMDYIQGNESLHIKVLMYEPVELDVLKSDLKAASIKCSMEKLMDFLDEKCIAFTTKNSRKQPTGRRGRRKASKASQKSPKKSPKKSKS